MFTGIIRNSKAKTGGKEEGKEEGERLRERREEVREVLRGGKDGGTVGRYISNIPLRWRNIILCSFKNSMVLCTCD